MKLFNAMKRATFQTMCSTRKHTHTRPYRTVLHTQQTMSFKIPGTNFIERFTWLLCVCLSLTKQVLYEISVFFLSNEIWLILSAKSETSTQYCLKCVLILSLSIHTSPSHVFIFRNSFFVYSQLYASVCRFAGYRAWFVRNVSFQFSYLCNVRVAAIVLCGISTWHWRIAGMIEFNVKLKDPR